MNSKFNDNKYNIWGRKYPAIVCLTFPLLVIIYYFFDSLDDKMSQMTSVLKIILFFGSVIPSLFFFYMMTIRELSNIVIENILNWLFGKPTSNMLLPKFPLISKECKEEIKKYLKEDGIELDVNGKYNGNDANRRNRKYRHRVDEAVSMIKEEVRGDSILLEFNAVYGFFRNMTGGMLLNLLIWKLLNYLNTTFKCHCDTELWWSLWVIVALIVLGLFFAITSRYRYAKRLFSLYCNKKKKRNAETNTVDLPR